MLQTTTWMCRVSLGGCHGRHTEMLLRVSVSRGSSAYGGGVQEVTGMLNADVAKFRTEDLLRTAEARRATQAIVQRRRAARAVLARRMITTAVALLPIPVRH